MYIQCIVVFTLIWLETWKENPFGVLNNFPLTNLTIFNDSKFNIRVGGTYIF